VAHVGQEGAFGQAGGFGGQPGALEFLGGAAAVAQVPQNDVRRDASQDQRHDACQANREHGGQGGVGGAFVAALEIILFLTVEIHQRYAQVGESVGIPDLLEHRRIGAAFGAAYFFLEYRFDRFELLGLTGAALNHRADIGYVPFSFLALFFPIGEGLFRTIERVEPGIAGHLAHGGAKLAHVYQHRVVVRHFGQFVEQCDCEPN